MRRTSALVSLVVVLAVLALPAIANADSPIVSGAGSTWSQVAIDQWRADVSRFGLRINYQGVGSSAGRQFYVGNQVDFAVSEIPFEGNELRQLQSDNRQFVYLPIVAGGTSLMYNLRDTSGDPITTLHLSSATLVGIFTGEIKSWDDSRLRADNPGLALPPDPVKPVVRSDGSGTSAQFTAYLSFMEPTKWCDFAKSQNIDCKYTSNYPEFSGAVSASGSDGVANTVHSESSGHGAITYVETAYALQRGRPVAFLKNASGNYTLPTSSNVSTALLKATLNSDNTQNLTGVYQNGDPNAYAMSSYSYMIAPTNNIDSAKGSVLGQFMVYFACAGQRKADLLGYSPLPPNLVQVVFNAEQRVPGAPKPPAIDQCDNPTIKGGAGSVSNGTAGALSGGQSTTGAATATGAPRAGQSAARGTGGRAGASGVAANELGGVASGAGTNEIGGAAGGSSAGSAYGPQALPRLSLRAALPSGAPLGAAALLLALAVFGPPMWASFARRRRS